MERKKTHLVSVITCVCLFSPQLAKDTDFLKQLDQLKANPREAGGQLRPCMPRLTWRKRFLGQSLWTCGRPR